MSVHGCACVRVYKCSMRMHGSCTITEESVCARVCVRVCVCGECRHSRDHRPRQPQITLLQWLLTHPSVCQPGGPESCGRAALSGSVSSGADAVHLFCSMTV